MTTEDYIGNLLSTKNVVQFSTNLGIVYCEITSPDDKTCIGQGDMVLKAIKNAVTQGQNEGWLTLDV